MKEEAKVTLIAVLLGGVISLVTTLGTQTYLGYLQRRNEEKSLQHAVFKSIP